MNCSLCGHPIPEAETSWEFFIPIQPPSLNWKSAAVNSKKAHAYRKLRSDFFWLIRNAKTADGIPNAKRKRRVALTRIYGSKQRELDPDNLSGGCKVLLDALKNAQLIIDDKGEYAEVHYFQRKGKEAGVVIRIDELSDA